MAISLEVRYSKQEEEHQRQSYDLKVEVLNAVDVSSKIFVFQRSVLSVMDADANREMDQFVNIASPVDLEETPEDSPDLSNDMPYFRKASVTLRFRSMIELEETMEAIAEDIQELVDALKAAETLQVMETVTYV